MPLCLTWTSWPGQRRATRLGAARTGRRCPPACAGRCWWWRGRSDRERAGHLRRWHRPRGAAGHSCAGRYGRHRRHGGPDRVPDLRDERGSPVQVHVPGHVRPGVASRYRRGCRRRKVGLPPGRAVHRVYFPAGIALDAAMPAQPAVRAIVSSHLSTARTWRSSAPACASRSGPTPRSVTRYGTTARSDPASLSAEYPRLCLVLTTAHLSPLPARFVDTASRRCLRRPIAAT